MHCCEFNEWLIDDVWFPDKFNEVQEVRWHKTILIDWLINNERSVWNKALSDFWCNVKFFLSFTTEYKEIWKENLVIYQKSLKALLQAPLQLIDWLEINKLSDSSWSSIGMICKIIG